MHNLHVNYTNFFYFHQMLINMLLINCLFNFTISINKHFTVVYQLEGKHSFYPNKRSAKKLFGVKNVFWPKKNFLAKKKFFFE